MLLDVLFHPFMLGLLYPTLIIVGIVALLLPTQGEVVTYEYSGPKPATYDKSDITETIPVVRDYGTYDTYDTRPVGALWGEEMERQMMARVLAFEILYELGQKARKNNALALCA